MCSVIPILHFCSLKCHLIVASGRNTQVGKVFSFDKILLHTSSCRISKTSNLRLPIGVNRPPAFESIQICKVCKTFFVYIHQFKTASRTLRPYLCSKTTKLLNYPRISPTRQNSIDYGNTRRLASKEEEGSLTANVTLIYPSLRPCGRS